MSNDIQNSSQNTRDPNAVQCFRCQGWGHMAREYATPAKALNKDGRTEGNVVKPPASINS